MAMEIIVVARDKSVMAKCEGADEYVRDMIHYIERGV